jgi:sarcosine/dimethylglycine N-methyltransferase
MTTQNYSEPVNTAREYYNSEDADNFYFTVWGGEDIHVGLYESDREPIFDASRRTVERMASYAKNLNKDSKVIDVGAGYGGSARYLAKTYGCHVVALNLSETENERDRAMNKEQGLDHLIDVVDGDFEQLPYESQTFDLVWSQDAFLHSGNRDKVISEVARVMKPGADLIFTDPMQADNCPEGVLDPILERIHLDTLGSPGFYKQTGAKYGLKTLAFEEMTHQLVNHYSRVLRELEERGSELTQKVSAAYIERMKKGLRHWVEGGKKGHLSWGVFHLRREK